MADIRGTEHAIPINGAPVKSFWDAVSTSDVAQAGIFVSDATQYSGPDGYVELTSTANIRSSEIEGFYTALRVVRSAVPLVSLRHSYDWFQCFSARIGTNFDYLQSTATVHVFNITDTTKSVRVDITPTSASLNMFGTVFDFSDIVFNIATSANTADGVLTLGPTDFFLVARRTDKPVTGTRAEFEVKAVLYNLVVYVIGEVTLRMTTTDLYQADFLCRIDPGADEDAGTA